MLNVEHVRKDYGAVTAVQDFVLDVDAGQFVALVGPSGCGKTTMLRILAGLLSPTSGSIKLDGKTSLNPSPEKGLVFQNFNLFPWRTALGNVAFGLEVQGVGRAERTERAKHYLKLVGLGDLMERYPRELSGGQSQRVGLARALSTEPKLLLLDEPFGAIDALTREYLQITFQQICTQKNLTTILVTHSIDEAVFLADRIVVMGTPGRVLAEFEVKLARPRWEYNWRATEEYTALRSSVWELLKSNIEGGADDRRQHAGAVT